MLCIKHLGGCGEGAPEGNAVGTRIRGAKSNMLKNTNAKRARCRQRRKNPDAPLTADDLTEQLLRGVSEKRHAAHQELVEDDAHRPPVHRLPVALTQNHLRGDILWGATHLERNRQIGNQRQRQQQQIKPPKDANFMQKKKKTGKMPINSTTSYICAS